MDLYRKVIKMKSETINYYNENAKEFCAGTVNADMSVCRNKFTALLECGTRILDAGCGSGRDSKVFLDMGYDVISMDASSEVCKEAEAYLGKHVLCKSFEEIEFSNEFDGIWACASLLHVSRNDIDFVFEKLNNALKDNGVLYVSFKYGENERIKDGRFFNDYTEETLTELLKSHSFKIEEIFISFDVRKERESEKWVNAIVVK